MSTPKEYQCGLDCRVGNPEWHCTFLGDTIADIRRGRPHDCENQVKDIHEALKDKNGEYVNYKSKW